MAGVVSPPRFRLRIVDYESAELYCHGCRDWLPVTMEFWPSRTSFWRCRACERERSRLYQARRRLDPEGRLKDINKSRRYRAYLRNEEPELLSAYEAERLAHESAVAREKRAKDRDERRRAYNREWMRQKRARAKAA